MRWASGCANGVEVGAVCTLRDASYAPLVRWKVCTPKASSSKTVCCEHQRLSSKYDRTLDRGVVRTRSSSKSKMKMQSKVELLNGKKAGIDQQDLENKAVAALSPTAGSTVENFPPLTCP